MTFLFDFSRLTHAYITRSNLAETRCTSSSSRSYYLKEKEYEPAPKNQQQLMLRAEMKQSFHPKRTLKMMVVLSKRLYSKEINYLDDAAFTNTDMSSGTCTHITSQIVDATTKLTSHYHHR
nr:hypothetical protein [Tanacetum cinerariifolium]